MMRTIGDMPPEGVWVHGRGDAEPFLAAPSKSSAPYPSSVVDHTIDMAIGRYEQLPEGRQVNQRALRFSPNYSKAVIQRVKDACGTQPPPQMAGLLPADVRGGIGSPPPKKHKVPQLPKATNLLKDIARIISAAR